MGFRVFVSGLILFVLVSTHSQPVHGDTGHDDNHSTTGAGQLHFSHPLIAESPTPDTKLRVDYFFRNTEDTGQENEFRLEAEYAFNRNLSIEIDVPFVVTDPDGIGNQSNLDNIKIGLKAATFAFENKGLVLGGGIEFNLPTGDDEKMIGSDRVLKIEPFIDLGYKVGNFEIISSLVFAIPTNEPAADKDEEDLELEFNLALQAHLTDQIVALLEFDGSSVVSGHDNKTVVNITPGIKFHPHGDDNLEFGVGVSYPLSNDKNFDPQLIVSLFRHF